MNTFLLFCIVVLFVYLSFKLNNKQEQLEKEIEIIIQKILENDKKIQAIEEITTDFIENSEKSDLFKHIMNHVDDSIKISKEKFIDREFDNLLSDFEVVRCVDIGDLISTDDLKSYLEEYVLEEDIKGVVEDLIKEEFEDIVTNHIATELSAYIPIIKELVSIMSLDHDDEEAGRRLKILIDKVGYI